MIIAANNYHKLSDHQYLERLIIEWETSPVRQMQLDGERYYRGDHDILKKRRRVIGADGNFIDVKNLPNNRIHDNQLGKMVDQKKNYLLGKPIAFKSDDEKYVEQLQTVFNKKWQKRIKDLGEHCINCGVAWVHPYIKNDKMLFKVFPGYQIMPIWLDAEEEELAMAVRLYLEERADTQNYNNMIRKVELYKPDGVEYYIFENNHLVPDVTKPKTSYLKFKTGDAETDFNWERIPMIPFKFNSKMIPLIKRAKCLQDGLNEIISKYKDCMDIDPGTSVIVLKNYDGENLADFRQKLAQYNAIKIRDTNGGSGGVETLDIEVNAANYESIIKVFKEAIIDNCRGYDFTELKSGSPNQMNIKSILSDIDMDANDMETEFQAAMEDLLWFVNCFLGFKEDEKKVDVIFNRDTVVNETEVIASMVSMGVEVSNRTKLAQLPFIDDPDAEQERVDKEKEEAMEAYASGLPMDGAPMPGKGAVTPDKGNDKPKKDDKPVKGGNNEK